MTDNSRIRVSVIGDHAVVRRGLRNFFADIDGHEVARDAETAEAGLSWIGLIAAHGECRTWTLLDVVMPGMDGADATAEIASRHPGVRIVILARLSQVNRAHRPIPCTSATDSASNKNAHNSSVSCVSDAPRFPSRRTDRALPKVSLQRPRCVR